jgi:linoleoyl-CoA desaturase
MALGLSIALVFQMAHAVEETTFPVPNDANKIENEWAIHQVETTANFAMNNKIISWLVGGLNYQVEHHLYPKISHIHYPQISKIVRETCDEMQVKYNAFPSFWRAILSHYGYLKLLGTK